MARKQTVASLLSKYTIEEAELSERVTALQEELATATDRLDEIQVVREALADAHGAPAKPKAAKPAAKEATKPKAKKATKRRAKGRRKANAKGVHALGIVDAALYLAKEKNQPVASAGDVLDWFLEVGYKTRSGDPNRNSVYVSLNREASQERGEDAILVSRPERGKFKFHYENMK